MVNKLALGHRLIEAAAQSRRHSSCRCLVGFDGFTDVIVRVVNQRENPSSYTPMSKISELTARLRAAEGKSCNLELVTTEKRIGGNAPLLTLALLEGGHDVTFAGAIGDEGQIDPLFSPLESACERTIALCTSGHTDALEFNDGKVLLGKMSSLNRVSYETLLKHLSEEELVALFEDIDLFASVNWTMLPHMTDLWEKLITRILPRCQVDSKKVRWLCVDLADTAKRSRADLKKALRTLQGFQPFFNIVLHLNHAELSQVYYALESTHCDVSIDTIPSLAKTVQKATGFAHIVVHGPHLAVAATKKMTYSVEAPYFDHPLTSTGAGDHFNGGYSNALLFGLDVEECLTTAIATCAHLILQGKTPSMHDVANFLQLWDQGTFNLEKTLHL